MSQNLPHNLPHNVKSIDDLLNNVVTDSIDDALFAKKTDIDRIYLHKPVSLLEFAESKDFLGLQGDLFPKVRSILGFIDQPHIREVYLVLGKGSGKSTILEINSLYGVYLWSCMRDPYEYFNLLPTAKVACVNVSSSREQAKDVVFEGCLTLVQRCPFFNPKAGSKKYHDFKNYLTFDSGITLYAGHGNAAAWLGYATFRGGMDETEFMVDSQNRSQARQLYNALRGSLRTRFPNDYKLVAISSAKERFSFLMKKASLVLKLGAELKI